MEPALGALQPGDNTVAIVAIAVTGATAVLAALISAVAAHFRQRSRLAHDQTMSDRGQAREVASTLLAYVSELEYAADDNRRALREGRDASPEDQITHAERALELLRHLTTMWLHFPIQGDPLVQAGDNLVDAVLAYSKYVEESIADPNRYDDDEASRLESAIIDHKTELIANYSARLRFAVDLKPPRRSRFRRTGGS